MQLWLILSFRVTIVLFQPILNKYIEKGALNLLHLIVYIDWIVTLKRLSWVNVLSEFIFSKVLCFVQSKSHNLLDNISSLTTITILAYTQINK